MFQRTYLIPYECSVEPPSREYCLGYLETRGDVGKSRSIATAYLYATATHLPLLDQLTGELIVLCCRRLKNSIDWTSTREVNGLRDETPMISQSVQEL